MKIRSLLGFLVALLAPGAHAQFFLDCSCLSTQSVLTTNACQAVIPDLCQFTNCYRSTVVPPPNIMCNQNPPAGTPVGPGVYSITVSVFVLGTPPQSCTLNFQVNPPPGGCNFSLICASNKTVECGSTWTFDPPGWTNECPNPAGTPGNVTVTVLSTVTNGVCPWTVTRTWQGVDDCNHVATCSQTVTVVDTLPPTLNCICLTNSAAFPPPPMVVTNCTGAIPDLCLYAQFCSFDQCGPLTCKQNPPAGTVVGVGVHPFSVTITDCAGNSASCTYNFTVIAPAGGCTTNPCPPTLAAVLNTGTVGGNGAVLGTGAPEQVWVNVAAPGGPTPMVVADTTGFPIAGGPWVGPNAVSAWVSPAVNTYGPAGWYTNRVIFNAPCPTVCLRGRIASDDDGYFFVNGVLVSGAGFTAWSNINHCANFVKGPNMIEFVVHNAGGPTGFRTELEFWTQCCCESQTNVFNSGMGAGNVPLPTGTPDPNYVLVSAPPGGCAGPAQVLNPSTLPSPPWVANGPNSQWIGAGSSAGCQEGVYHFRLCFNLPCADGAAIVGQWAVDDNGSMYLNGQPTGNTIPSQQFPNLPGYGWFPVSITNGFVCGTNCLDFYVTNASIGINPTGFRAELTNIFNDCCCPAPQPIFSVFSGQNSAGPLTSGAPDPQFTFTCAPPGVTTTTPVVTTPHPLWIPNGPNSQWIGPNQFNNAPAGVYCYTMQFVIPCPPGTPIKASLTGQWSADDTGTIFLNGAPTGNTLPAGWAFLNWMPINITSGFVSGVNTLTFYVTNAGGPTGLRVELTGAASCCNCTNPTPPDCSCTFTNGDFNTFVPVNATGGGWTSSGLFNGAGWQASGGNPGATFLLNNVGDPLTDPTISQTICCLTPGQCYTIRGQRKVQAWFGQTQPSFAVLVDGNPILTLPVPSNPADANWYDFAVSFTATNKCQTISFAAEYGGSDVSYWIDNIRLECCQTNSCIDCPPLNQTVTGCPAVMPNFTTNRFSGPGCTPIGPLMVTQSVPAGTPLAPGSTTVVIIRVCDATGQCRDCDVIVKAISTAGPLRIKCPNDIVHLTCTNAATVYYTPTALGNVGPVVCTPPSGTVFPLGTFVVTCTATNLCGGKATCTFNVAVKPQRPRWLCPWIAIGISTTPLGQAKLVSRPNLGSSGQDGIAMENLGSSGQDGVRLDFGPAHKFTFSTLLDFNVPEGTTFDIALPPDPANPNGVPLLSFHRKSGPKGYCVKTSTKFTDDPDASYRHTCISSNGDLHPAITWDTANMDTNVLLNVFYQPGVTSAIMTVTLDCLSREVSVEFPHCIFTTDNARKGWDGCIYGNSPPGHPKGKGTARLVLTPITTVVSPPITVLDLHSTSTSGQVFDDPSILARGGCKGFDGHVTLMKAYDDGNARGFEFTSFGDGGGIHLDLGHTEAFNLRLQKFETGDVPTQDDLITHVLGGVRVDGHVPDTDSQILDTLLLRGGTEDVECSADFSKIGSPTVRVQVLLQGMVVAERAGVPGVLSDPVLGLPEWPLSLGKLGGRTPCRVGTVRPGPIRLPGGGGGLAPALGAPDEMVIGDEFRILAEMPPGVPPPDFYYTGLDLFASDGPTWVVTNPQRALACPPTALSITPNGNGGVEITWPDAAFRLQGAEEVIGPWYDLGADAPVTVPPEHPARFFRLLCD